eukprot:TRINITY_DN8647_c0_g1_i7.p1 TRINITY_DN8647_c0_g1~~TRINITY_DN8647_c0_g1_i7.p1  ORF type:complete len:190 (-),score=24.91 TRINITY_DN8647_c0_g1_i7:6-575(-)
MDLIQGSTSPLDVKIEPTNLLPWIHPKASFTLPTDDTSLISFLAHDPGLTLRSFGDVPEIYIFVCFTRPCRVCQLVISGTSKFVRDSPKTVRIFADPPNFPDFYAMNQSPSHITCSLEPTNSKKIINMESPQWIQVTSAGDLRVSLSPASGDFFSYVTCLGIHVKDNFSNSCRTCIGFMEIHGHPVCEI